MKFLTRLLLATLALSAGCASLPKDFERKPSHALTDTSQTRLGRVVTDLRAQHPGESGFLPLGQGLDAFYARILLVQSADKTLDLQYYIWRDDLTGRVLYNQLLAAADRGVRVRILLDDLDTAGKDEMLAAIDAHPNVEIRLFNPFANRNARVGDFITDTRRVNRRMHNKSLTADNLASILGGRNIGDEYFDATLDVGFADMDTLCIGPVVPEVSAAFDLYWNSRWVYPLRAFAGDGHADAQQLAAYRKASDEFLTTAESSSYADAVRAIKFDSLQQIADMKFSWGRWKLVYDQPGKVDANKVTRETHLAPALKDVMDDTHSELIIVSPYFVPGEAFTDYLVGLEQRGVRVRIMTNSLAANDVPLVHAGYMRYRKDLVRGGVELYEFKPLASSATATDDGRSRWRGSSRASLHGKFIGFDQRYLFVGSFNVDGRSVALNTELGVFLESPEYASNLASDFDQRAMVLGYRVLLTEQGDLQWVTLEDGEEVRFDVEPETGYWTRFSTRVMSIIVPESQL